MTDQRLPDETTAGPGPAPAQPRRRLSARILAIGLLTVAAVALAVLVGVLALRLQDLVQRDERRQDAVAAARQEAVNFTTLDHESVERDLQRVIDGATGDFREDFESGVEDLQKLVVENKVVSTGEVLDAGVVTSDDDSARVLLVVDSTVSNAASPEGQIRRFRIQMDVVRDGSRWLVSALEFVAG